MHELLLVGLRVVDQAAEPSKPSLLQAVVDDVDRRALLADEQHALAAGDVVGDEVGDRLRLARARRALDDVAAAVRGALRSRRPGSGRRARPGSARRRRVRRGAGARRRPRGEREDRVERGVRRVLVEQGVVVADQRHLAVLEVAEREAARGRSPRRTGCASAALAEGGEHLLLFAAGGAGAGALDALLRTVHGPLAMTCRGAGAGDGRTTADEEPRARAGGTFAAS